MDLRRALATFIVDTRLYVDCELLADLAVVLSIQLVGQALNNEVLGQLKHGIHCHLEELLMVQEVVPDGFEQIGLLGLGQPLDCQAVS